MLIVPSRLSLKRGGKVCGPQCVNGCLKVILTPLLSEHTYVSNDHPRGSSSLEKQDWEYMVLYSRWKVGERFLTNAKTERRRTVKTFWCKVNWIEKKAPGLYITCGVLKNEECQHIVSTSLSNLDIVHPSHCSHFGPGIWPSKCLPFLL